MNVYEGKPNDTWTLKQGSGQRARDVGRTLSGERGGRGVDRPQRKK